jgi:hypothetical protein
MSIRIEEDKKQLLIQEKGQFVFLSFSSTFVGKVVASIVEMIPVISYLFCILVTEQLFLFGEVERVYVVSSRLFELVR